MFAVYAIVDCIFGEVCGLEGPDNTPFIAAYDLIGAGVFADDFCVGGTCSESLYGSMCHVFVFSSFLP